MQGLCIKSTWFYENRDDPKTIKRIEWSVEWNIPRMHELIKVTMIGVVIWKTNSSSRSDFETFTPVFFTLRVLTTYDIFVKDILQYSVKNNNTSMIIVHLEFDNFN